MYPVVIALLSKNARRNIKHTDDAMYKLVMSSYEGKVLLKGRPDDIGLERAVKHLKRNCMESGLRLRYFVIVDLGRITNISPLATLMDLQCVTCKNMKSAKDVRPLAALLNLRHLDCEGMEKVTDISPLASLSNMRRLNCSDMCHVTDIRPLSALKNLEHLKIGFRYNPRRRFSSPISRYPVSTP